MTTDGISPKSGLQVLECNLEMDEAKPRAAAGWNPQMTLTYYWCHMEGLMTPRDPCCHHCLWITWQEDASN